MGKGWGSSKIGSESGVVLSSVSCIGRMVRKFAMGHGMCGRVRIGVCVLHFCMVLYPYFGHGYLIIAQPKCASTTLMASLGKVTGLRAKQVMPKLKIQNVCSVQFFSSNVLEKRFYSEYEVCFEKIKAQLCKEKLRSFKECWDSLPHSDMVQKLPKRILHDQISSRYIIHKNHYPPSKENVNTIVSVAKKT